MLQNFVMPVNTMNLFITGLYYGNIFVICGFNGRL